jgi:hypothetical protein
VSPNAQACTAPGLASPWRRPAGTLSAASRRSPAARLRSILPFMCRIRVLRFAWQYPSCTNRICTRTSRKEPDYTNLPYDSSCHSVLFVRFVYRLRTLTICGCCAILSMST